MKLLLVTFDLMVQTLPASFQLTLLLGLFLSLFIMLLVIMLVPGAANRLTSFLRAIHPFFSSSPTPYTQKKKKGKNR